ncbi:hypothetical protein HYS47_01950 [Candidatus Woesearchaeota archaeon]|nr:hypothetical protein [Candidatus Woesearchaeota archaeon]
MTGDKTLQDDVLAYFKEEAVVAGGIALQHYQQLQPGEIKTKSGPTDLVTIADLEISKHVVETVTRTFGNRVVLLTEESSRGFVHDQHNHQPIMLVDELDGTMGYSRGGEFCHLFALAESVHGEYIVTVGLVYNPLRQELHVATIDTDAIRIKNGIAQPTHVSQQKSIEPSASLIHARLNLSQRRDYIAKYATAMRAIKNLGEPRLDQAPHLYRGTIGLEAMDVAEGKVDALLYQRAANWDYAAPALITQQAGGRTYLLKTQEQMREGRPWCLQLMEPAAYYPAMFTNGRVDEALFEELRKST